MRCTVSTYQPLKKALVQKQWFVLYTKPNAEKKLAERLQAVGIECYCPTRTEVRQWSDRKKKVEVPVLPSMVLVHIEDKHRNRVFDFAQAVRYLFWMNKPAVVRDIEVESLRHSLERKATTIQIESIKVGDKISLKEAGFENMEGTVTHFRGKQCWVVLDSIGYIVKLDLSN
jgi:transcriptional antiterminator RfaH